MATKPKKGSGAKSAAKPPAGPAAAPPAEASAKTSAATPAKAKASSTAAAKARGAKSAGAAKPVGLASLPAAASEAVTKATKSVGRAKPAEAARKAVAAATPDVSAAKARKAVRATGKKASSLIPDIELPHLPTGEVSHFVKTVGGQIVGALNSPVGRVMVAELLVFMAGSLTKAAADTEMGKDATGKMMKAGAKIGAAAASAGATMLESGSAAASSGASAATDAAEGAKDLAREVTQVAVSAVGGIVAEAASKMMKRGSKAKAEAPAPQAPLAGKGTPRPPQL